MKEHVARTVDECINAQSETLRPTLETGACGRNFRRGPGEGYDGAEENTGIAGRPGQRLKSRHLHLEDFAVSTLR
jgi:hypothetical protein